MPPSLANPATIEMQRALVADMERQEEKRTRTRFDIAALIASEGQPMSRPRLQIVDDEEYERMNEKLPTEWQHRPAAAEQDLSPWQKLVKPGMTVGEIRDLIREHGTPEEIAELGDA